jgi:hypothetical protein
MKTLECADHGSEERASKIRPGSNPNGLAGRFPSADAINRGVEAANGGMMGNVKKELTKTEKTSSKTGRKPRGRISRKAEVNTSNKPMLETSGATPASYIEPEPVDSGTLLRSAVEKEVARESVRMAKALVKKTIAGNMTGFRYAAEMTGARNPATPPKKKRHGPSQAQQLEEEPEWPGPPKGQEESTPQPTGSAI